MNRQSRRNRLSLLSGIEKSKSVDDDKLVHSDKDGGNTSTSDMVPPETPQIVLADAPPSAPIEPVEV